MQSIKRKRAGDNFTILSNEFLRDENLSLKAKGLLAYILSLPDDWKIYFEEVANHHKDSAKAARIAWKELEEQGYAKTTRVVDPENKQVKQWKKEVSDFKNPDYQKPHVANPDVENPQCGKGQLLNTNEPITDKQNTNPNKDNISDKSDKETDLENRFSLLWKIYPNKKGKPKAFTAYKKAVKSGVTDKEIQTGIENYLAEISAKGTLKDYIKHGSTWFNGKGWEDDYDTTPRQQAFTANNKIVKPAPAWSQGNQNTEYMTDEDRKKFWEDLENGNT
ncbi:helix-turn-helix domain-containing protein [Lactococcus petauri]